MTEIIAAPRTRFYRLNKVRKSLQTPWTLSVLLVLLVALIDSANLGNVIGTALAALAGTAPYIVIAVLLIGWLKATGAEAMVGRAFQGRESVMILMAAVFGGLAPFCSCEVIPFIAGLLAVGAPLSAVMAFWLSSPLIDPPTLFITAAALGWPFAVGKAVAAVGLGLFGGFVMAMLLAGGAVDFLCPRRSGCGGGRRRRGDGDCHRCRCRHAGLSQWVRRPAAAGRPDDSRHEWRRGDGFYGRRRGQLDPRNGGCLFLGESTGFRQLYCPWSWRCGGFWHFVSISDLSGSSPARGRALE